MTDSWKKEPRMSDLANDLREARDWLRDYNPDDGDLLSAAASRIEALEAEVDRLREAVRELFRLEAITETEDPGVGIDRYYARQKLAALAGEGTEDE